MSEQEIRHSGESKIAHCKECEKALLKITKKKQRESERES